MRIIAVILLAGLAMGTCGCGDKPQKSAKVARGPVSSQLSPDGTAKLTTTVSDYYALKNALVATNAAEATEAARKLEASATGLMSSLAGDSTNGAAIKPFLDTVINQSKVISGINDPKCEQQRIAFSPISNNMFSLLKAVQVKNAGVYKQYCPMAFNDKGAYWLSDEMEIKNPYFGKKMLECGEVQDSL